MTLDLRPVFSEPGKILPVSGELDLSFFETASGCPIREPAKITGQVKNTAGVVTLEGIVSFIYSAPCDRCAKEVSVEMSVPLRHTLVEELSGDDIDEFIVIESGMLELDELAVDDVILSLPTKFLCSDDCKGLCTTCGKNLNDGPCSCQKDVDPRLAALQEFLQED